MDNDNPRKARRFARWKPRYSGWMGDREAFRIVALALLVGVMAGSAGVVLRWLVTTAQALLFSPSARPLVPEAPYLLALLPAAGGLVVGLMVVFLAQEARGAGVADVVLAVRYRHSRMRLRVAAAKVAATSIAIGSGGSAGIEGPIIQIGSALGSGTGRRLSLSEEELRITLAAGAAAGIAATFNTPLAGVFFALEVILLDFSSRSFGVVVLAAVVANVVSRLALGDAPIFPVPQHMLVHPVELPLYAVLGGLAAVLGVAFIGLLDYVEAGFARLGVPDWSKPAVGGLAVGAIGLAFPQVLGLGYDAVGAALRDQFPLGLMAALVGAKLLATCLTVGSGSSGGVIGPSLYLGAMLGGSIGSLVHGAMPQITATPGAYALVGMAAVFAATARAPITAIFTLFELTNDYQAALPLMVACVSSTYLAQRLTPHTIYSKGLIRRGIDLVSGRVSLPPLHGTMYLDLLVEQDSEAAGKQVRDLKLPAECLLISVRRHGDVVIPRGETGLEAGDRITVAARPECAEAVRGLVHHRERKQDIQDDDG